MNPPIRITFMISCYVNPDPESTLGSTHWNSQAGFETRRWLKENNLIDEDNKATERGKAWIEMFCSTPLPIAKWVHPNEGEDQ
jgi:hypothetical protein